MERIFLIISFTVSKLVAVTSMGYKKYMIKIL
jgi:hypothetical protein